MRRVQLDQLDEDMKLAKSIFHNGNLILAEGTDNLQEYAEGLKGYGVFSLYIEDGIDIVD